MVKSLEKLTKKIFSKKHSYGFDFSPISPKLLWIILISVGAIAITGTAIAIAAVVKDSKVEPGPQGEKGEKGQPGRNGVDGACITCDETFDKWYKKEEEAGTLKGASAYTQWFDTICKGGNDPLISKDNGALLQKLNGEFVDGEWKDGPENSGCSPEAFYNWLAMKSREQIQGGFGNDPAEPYKITVANATNATNATTAKDYATEGTIAQQLNQITADASAEKTRVATVEDGLSERTETLEGYFQGGKANSAAQADNATNATYALRAKLNEFHFPGPGKYLKEGVWVEGEAFLKYDAANGMLQFWPNQNGNDWALVNN